MSVPLPGLGVGGTTTACERLRAEISNLTATISNLNALLARTNDPIMRANIQSGISDASAELHALQEQVPFTCAPAIPIAHPIPVLIVADGDFSFSSVRPQDDGYFTLSQFVTTLNATKTTNPLRPVNLTLAHRQADAAGARFVNGPGIPAPITNAYFTWQSGTVPSGAPSPNSSPLTAVDLSEFRVVFLFGVQSISEILAAESITNPDTTPAAELFQVLQNQCLAWDGAYGEAQLWAFVQFMDNGGGLFAAGDHEDLGAPLCGAIPRVRSMRRWLFSASGAVAPLGDAEVDATAYDTAFTTNEELSHPANRAPYANLGMRCAPPALGSARLDTLQGSPVAVTDAWTRTQQVGIPFDYQSDDVPQPLTVVTQHPIFSLSGGGQLAVMPDHMHEGMTIDLTDFAAGQETPSQTYTHVDLVTGLSATISEYPSPGGGSAVFPQVLATETTTGGHETPSTETEHTGSLDWTGAPVVFGAVSAYDGSPESVGRIVVQSTFHHFFDINILGDPATDVTDPQSKLGFTSSPYLAQFEQYWVNLVTWLANPATAAALLLVAVDRARRSVSIRKAASPRVAAHGEAVNDLGELVTRLIDRHVPLPLLRDAVHHTMPATHAQRVATWLAEWREGEPEIAAAVDRVFMRGFMGGAVLHGLSYPREQQLAADVEATAPQVVQAGLRGAARALAASTHHNVAQPLIAILASGPGKS